MVTPVEESQVQPVILCAKQYGLQVRTLSGGHHFEGLSYVSSVPFAVINLINLRSITVDAKNQTAWVQAGATLGELYYHIAKASKTLDFPAGLFPTVGVGGHISGAGYGNLIRKYGVAADCVVDVRMMSAYGVVIDKNSLGNDLFWAIRGGGGSSFGVILAYKLRLVYVPKYITVFAVNRTLEQNDVTQLIYHWQSIAPKLHRDLTLRLSIGRSPSSNQTFKKTIVATFFATFLGEVDRLLKILPKDFPMLGLVKQECIEMSWIESVLYFGGLGGKPPEALLSRSLPPKFYMKGKSDFVQKVIPENGLKGIWKIFLSREEAETTTMDWTPFGGRMDIIPESEIAFPHRSGYLYMIFYGVNWDGSNGGTDVGKRHIDWLRDLYSHMTPYVSKSPRASFFPCRDLDLGVNNIRGSTSFEQASIWGFKYFKNNFNRLVQVKTMADPHNFLQDEQSTPPLPP